MANKWICCVCLSTNKLLKELNYELAAHFDMLCDYKSGVTQLQCCSDCEKILMSHIDFKNKCRKANFILTRWLKSKKKEKRPIESLHNLLNKWIEVNSEQNCSEIRPETYNDKINAPPENEIKTVLNYEMNEEIEENNEDYVAEAEGIYDKEIDTYKFDSKMQFYEGNLNFPQNDETMEQKSSSDVTDYYDGSDSTNENQELDNDDTSQDNGIIESNKESEITYIDYDVLDEDYVESIDNQDHEFVNDNRISCDETASQNKEIKKEFDINYVYYRVADEELDNEWEYEKATKETLPPTEPPTNDDDEIIRTVYNGHNYSKYEDVFYVHVFKTKKEVRDEFVRRRITEPYLSAQYRCDICYTVYRSEKLLIHHMKWHDAATRPFSCNICAMRFPNDIVLRKHDGRAHRSKFICKICPFFTYYSSIMVKHYRSHPVPVDALETSVRCEPCDLTFADPAIYNLHVLRTEAHSDIAGLLIACSTCGKEFNSQEEVEIHKKLPHGGPKNHRFSRSKSKSEREPVVCKECGDIGPTYRWLFIHHYRTHPGVPYTPYADTKRTHLCDECGQGFVNNALLQEHKSMHTGVRPYQCDHCNKTFRTKWILRGHLAWHSPPTFQCHMCHKRFHTQHRLTVHLRVHDKNRCIKCVICGAGFFSGETRMEHMRGVHLHMRRNKKKKILVKEDDNSC